MNQLNWDAPNTYNVEEQQRNKYEENLDFLKTFSTPHGKRVLDWMTKHTLETPTWWPSADYNKAVANGFFREGQNSLVRQLHSKIDYAKQYKESQK